MARLAGRWGRFRHADEPLDRALLGDPEGDLLVIKQTARIEFLVRGYVVRTLGCYGPKNLGGKRKRCKAVRGDYIAILNRTQFLVKLMASIFRYMFGDKTTAIACMTMVIEKSSMCQRQRPRTDRGNWHASGYNGFDEGRNLLHLSAHPGVTSREDQDIC